MWIPVMADTSKLGQDLKRAGEEGKRAFLDGFGDTAGKVGEGLSDGFREAMPGISSIIQGGIVAGLTAAFITKGFEVVSAGMEKITEVITEGVHKAAEEILTIGESWEKVDRQLQLTTTATGDAFEGLAQSAQNVVRSGLDVSINNLGSTMGVLHSRLDLTGPSLERLTQHVMELRDRFSDLSPDRLTQALGVFNVSGAQADQVLASLTQSARSAGDSLGVVVNNLADSGSVLSTAGLSIEQAGAFIADMDKKGISVTKMLTGFSTAEKQATKDHISFGDELKKIATQIEAMPSQADRAEKAFSIFGTRNWTQALAVLQDYLNVVNSVPGAFDASTGSLDAFLSSSASLENKFDALKNKAELIFKPFGDAAMEQIGRALDELGKWVETNHNKIVNFIQEIGDRFIATLPVIENFAAGVLTVLGPMFDAIDGWVSVMVMHFGLMEKSIGLSIEALSTPLTRMLWPGLDDTAKKMLSAGDASVDMGKKIAQISVTPELNQLRDWIQNHVTDVNGATDAWDRYTNSMKNATMGPFAGGGLTTPSQAPGGTPSGPSFGPYGPGGGMPGAGGMPRGLVHMGGLNLSTIPVAAQKYANDCIDASARIILSHSGVNMSEDQLENVITPGGSISSLAAGLNQLDPQGNFKALEGSGGSPQAMFGAIKASIDNGSGSILNVAPGSSLAGHTFAPGHFIAVTGYNPDGTVNVSDTAGGRQYTVSQADAFQATQGRGIVAGTGMGPPPSGVAGSPGQGFPLPWKLSGGPGDNSGGVDVSPDFPQPLQWPTGIDLPSTPPAADPGSSSSGSSSPIPVYPFTPISPVNMPTVGYNKQGMPMSGAYGGITTEQATSDAEAVQTAQHRLELAKAEVNSLTAQIAAAEQAGKDAATIHDLQQRQAEAIYNQSKATQELGDSQTKQSDEWNKIPSSESSRGKSSKSDALGSQLGSGLLKGIGQELGFGDLFGKSPMEWGLFKLAAGVAGYGLNLGNAWADNKLAGGQGGGAPMPGGGGGVGMGGLLQAIPGVRSFVNPAASAPNTVGPNVQPVNGMPGQSRPDDAPNLAPGQVSNTFNIQAQNPPAAAQTFSHLTNSNGFQNSMGTAGIGPTAQG